MTNKPFVQQALGKRILAARMRKGWNLTVLAAKARVSRTTLFQMERGAIPSPRASTLYRLAAALEIPVSQLTSDNLPAPESPPATDSADSTMSSLNFPQPFQPYVDVIRQQFPEIFDGFTPEDWNELYTSFSTLAAITNQEVLDAATGIARKRETLRRLSILLKTDLAEPAAAMVNGLFELIPAPVNAAGFCLTERGT